MKELDREFSLLIKPASFNCNLRCDYCFYLRKKDIFSSGLHRMSDKVLRRMISSFMKLPMRQYSFAWQGGEPTLMGVDFFEKAVGYMKKYGDAEHKNVANALQTNGTLIDRRWCEFFRKYNFLIGVSLDGPKDIHNLYRSDSFARVMNGIKLLREHQVEFNILTLVSKANVKKPLEVYEFLKSQGVRFQQYIECVEFDQSGKLREFCPRSGEYGEFLCKIFDSWYENDTNEISVRLFDSILEKLVSGRANCCSLGNRCDHYLVVEYNGNVYCCDFFVQDDWLLGNVLKDSWTDMRGSDKYREFAERKSLLGDECTNCLYFDLCAGCCPKNRRNGKSVICADWKIFYSHTIERFKLLAKRIIDSRAPGSFT